jgi:hypothetical protein
MVCVSLGRMVEMTMEMRWLERTIELRIPFSMLSYTDSETVLQYRTSKDSKWIDVPTVKE